jgi:hypothetical protein
MNHEQLERQAMRALTREFQAHADAMADELHTLYNASAQAGSPISGLAVLVSNYYEYKERLGLAKPRPLLEIVGS